MTTSGGNYTCHHSTMYQPRLSLFNRIWTRTEKKRCLKTRFPYLALLGVDHGTGITGLFRRTLGIGYRLSLRIAPSSKVITNNFFFGSFDMLRTSHVYNHDVPENPGRVGAKPRDDAMSKSSRPSLSGQVHGGVPSIPEPEQRTIYYEWISQSSLIEDYTLVGFADAS